MSSVLDSSVVAPLPDAGALEAWQSACRAAELTAIDPIGTAGVIIAGAYGETQQLWLRALQALLGPSQRFRRVPGHIGDDRLLGGLDLAATLSAGRPIVSRGLLAEANGCILLLPSAERMSQRVSAQIASARDLGGIDLQRDGASVWSPTRFGIIAFDESMPDEEGISIALADRVGMRVDLDGIGGRVAAEAHVASSSDIAEAQSRLASVIAGEDAISALCSLCVALGIRSLRPPQVALAVARANAALCKRNSICEDDLVVAVRLSLAWRATQFPQTPDDPDNAEPESEPPPDDGAEPDQEPERPDETQLSEGPAQDRLIEAAQTSLPADLLAAILTGSASSRPALAPPSRTGLQQRSKSGRARAGIMPGDPRTGSPLSIFATLLAAAPKQSLRNGKGVRRGGRLAIRPEDFRVYRMRQHQQTVTIFVVDASGSAALNRLAEAKGAVELLLNDCYVRRDQVSLIAFRGPSAQVLLPPTSALARAKRSLAKLPGGGGTPLACGLATALTMASATIRRGQTPLVVVLTDGRANIARNGRPGRAEAEADALREAGQIARLGIRALLIDTSVRPDQRAERLAKHLAARYLPLPRAGSTGIRDAVLGAMEA